MKLISLGLGLFVGGVLTCSAAVVFQAAGTNPAAIQSTVDSFRAAIGGDRREINWDGVPDTFSDPNPLPADFFNTNSPRGAVFSTPGTGFLVSANGFGSTAALFGFSSDFQTFSPLKLFTAVSSNIVDVSFFLPGTLTMATTSAFGLVFVDVEVAGSSSLQFFDPEDNLLFSEDALVAGNQGLSFLGGIMDADGPQIGRVRITSGLNTIVANGLLGDAIGDGVVMDDFIYATPTVSASSVSDSGSVVVLLGGALVALAALKRRIAA